jgi:hypothetical protein
MLVVTKPDANYQRWPSSRVCYPNSPTPLSPEWRRMSADVFCLIFVEIGFDLGFWFRFCVGVGSVLVWL